MGLERLKEGSRETGVKELWRGEVSPEVKAVADKAQEVLGNGKNLYMVRCSNCITPLACKDLQKCVKEMIKEEAEE